MSFSLEINAWHSALRDLAAGHQVRMVMDAANIAAMGSLGSLMPKLAQYTQTGEGWDQAQGIARVLVLAKYCPRAMMAVESVMTLCPILSPEVSGMYDPYWREDEIAKSLIRVRVRKLISQVQHVGARDAQVALGLGEQRTQQLFKNGRIDRVGHGKVQPDSLARELIRREIYVK